MILNSARYSRSLFDSRGHKAETAKRALKLTPFVLGAVIALLAVPFIIMNGLRTNRNLAEWWTTHIAAGYERFAGTLTSWLPVSAFELFVVLLILVGVFLFVRLVINLSTSRFYNILKGVLCIGVGAIYVANIYMLSMGFGYYRAPLPLVSAGADYDTAQVTTTAFWFLDDFNALAEKLERDDNGCVIPPYTYRELAKRMKGEFDRLDNDYFFDYGAIAKPVTNSWFLSDVLITGITFLPTGEANVNVAAPPTTATYTMAHEIAHTKGVQREGDANLISYYVMLSSNDDYIRYCGYYATFYSFIWAVSLVDSQNPDYAKLVGSISPLTRAEYKYTSQYWDAQPDLMGQIGEFFNNLYLLFNGADNGTGSYDDGRIPSVETPEDPDTGEIVIIPVYSSLQKIYFYLYEQTYGTPPKAVV